MEDPIKLLSIVRDFEFNFNGADETRLKNILEQALKKWEEIDFVSFATAFEVQGRMMVNIFNRLIAPGSHIVDSQLDLNSRQLLEKKFCQFMGLVRYPDLGKGLWPWDIRRIETPGEVGCFPPKIIYLKRPESQVEVSEKDRKEILRFGGDVWLDFILPPGETNNIEINNFFNEVSPINDQKLLIQASWKWFAVYPCMLAEEIYELRGRTKKSTILVYLLGTRKEFAKRPQNDFGLIVGLTAEVLENQKLAEVVDAITFAWNMLAVSPHILDDGLKIAQLEAGRHIVHTVRTYITVEALPTIKFLVGKHIKSEQAKELIIDVTNEIATLPAMMSFVSRRPLEHMDSSTDGLRAVDCSEYNLVESISEFLIEQLEERRGFSTEITCDIHQEYYQKLCKDTNKWINELYLMSALSEVVANIEKNSIAGSKVKILLATMEKIDAPVMMVREYPGHETESKQIFRIKVTNALNPQKVPNYEYEYDRQKSPIHGLKSLEAFFEALGGNAKGELDPDGYTYSTIMDYNLTQWEKGMNLLANN
ncbi:MAG TPA: hypothetical protein DCY88_20055 [Cyanobacteria bacterium UBA11372]|nr:hypothetical protein [Cyanobacteria bacterium UBA11372]